MKLQPYQPIRQLAQNLYVIDGEWEGTAFKRRMTVIKLKNGDLALHSAIQLSDDDLLTLEKLGRVRFILVPNIFHDSDAGFYRKRYPAAELYAPRSSVAKFGKQGLLARSFAEWPEALNGDLACLPIDGTRFSEAAFFHHASSTLILCDAAFNMQAEDFKPGFEFKFMRWNQVIDTFGPSRIFRWLLTANKTALAKSIARIEQKKFERIIVNHGQIVEGSDARKKFSDAFSYLK